MGSRVPEVIDALVTLGTQPDVLPGVRVLDGPVVTQDQANEWLLVGYDGDAVGDFDAGQGQGGWSDLGTGREELFNVTVAVVVSRTAQQIREARQRAYEIADVVDGWLKADATLGLPGLEAGIETSGLVQEQTDGGVRVRLLLTVVGRGFT